VNCANHPELTAVAYCRMCGKALCENCRRLAGGTIYCAEHAPAPMASDPGPSPYTSPAAVPLPDTGASPALAFLLGLIPGVGAIYNGQYVKGLIHVVIFGILVSIVHSDEAAGGLEPLFGMLIPAWVFYMAFEAYHTAKRRRIGQPVEEFSSLMPLKGRPGPRSTFPAGPAVLIAVGVLFLLHNLNILRLSQIIRYWPVALIALGAYMLYERLSTRERVGEAGAASAGEATHEQQQL
jgi:hypothetical protein